MKTIPKAVIYLFVSCLVFWRLWLPVPHVANDFPYLFPQAVTQASIGIPQTWNTIGSDGLGYYSLDTQWSWAIDSFVKFTGRLFRLPFWLSTQVIFIIPIIFFTYLGVTRLLGFYKIGSWGQLAGCFVYLLNSYVLLLIDGGQMSLAVAYSLLPLSFFLYQRSVKDFSVKSIIYFSTISLLISLFDIRFVYLLVTMIVIGMLFSLNLVRNLVIGSVTAVLLLGFHSYWLFPSTLTSNSGLPVSYTQQSQLSFLNFTTLTHSLFLSQPHWFKNIFGRISAPNALFMALPILAFLSPVLNRKKTVAYWLFSALIYVFLAKGTSPPFGFVYSLLFAKLPGFYIFRDSTKFFSLLSVTYSVLVGFSIDAISKKNQILTLGLLLLLLLPCYPLLKGTMTGTFSRAFNESAYNQLAHRIGEDETFGRVVWVPALAPLSYTDKNHPSLSTEILAEKHTFSVGTIGKYESLNFLRESTYMGELMSISGVKYLVLAPPDPRRVSDIPETKTYFKTLEVQFDKLPWLTKVWSHKDLTLYQTNRQTARFFIPDRTILVLGSSEDKLNTSIDLSRNALIFLDQQPKLISNLLPNALGFTVDLQDKKLIDLAASFIPKENYLFPAQVLQSSPTSLELWWKRETGEHVWWRDFFESKYKITNSDFDLGGGLAFAEGVTRHDFKLPACSGKCVILARLLTSTRGGTIAFAQGNKELTKINTREINPTAVVRKVTGLETENDSDFQFDKSSFFWHVIGESDQQANISLSTSGDLNVVNALALIPQTDWNTMLKQATYITNNSTLPSSDYQAQSAHIVFSQTSPSSYRVKVTNITRPALLVFSDNYNSSWQANGLPSFPAYGLFNSFIVNKAGNYEIELSNQKYVGKLLPVSLITVFTFIILWLIQLLNHARSHRS